MKPITFPNLGLEFLINPVAFSIGEKDIYWYGIIITFGIALAIFLAWSNRKKQKIEWDTIIDFVLVAIPAGIICARLYYVLFDIEQYIEKPLKVFELRSGGLAIYGGIIGGAITCYIFCKKRRYKNG